MRTTKLALLLGVAIVSVAFAYAGEVDALSPEEQQANSESRAKQAPGDLIFENHSTYQVLDHAVDLWHDAVLKDNQNMVMRRELEINDILIENIQTNKLQMKMLVRQVELCYRENSQDSRNMIKDDRIEKEVSQYKERLSPLTSMICLKEELYRAISRTETFSNKYRLLGDYLGVLRKELGMPRIPMAEIPAKHPSQASKEK